MGGGTWGSFPVWLEEPRGAALPSVRGVAFEVEG